jgi:hypothetical protein
VFLFGPFQLHKQLSNLNGIILCRITHSALHIKTEGLEVKNIRFYPNYGVGILSEALHISRVVYSSGFQPEVLVPPGAGEDVLGGT